MRGKHIELVFIFDNQIISPLLFIVSMEFRDFISARVYTVCRPAFLHLWVLSMDNAYSTFPNFLLSILNSILNLLLYSYPTKYLV